jgi:membrane protease YdiL (CAAX protease family)
MPETMEIAGRVATLLLALGLIVDAFLVAWLVRKPVDWSAAAQRLARRPWSNTDGALVFLVLLSCYVLVLCANSLLRFVVADVESSPFAILLHTGILHGTGLVLILTLVARRRICLGNAFGMDARNLGRDTGLGILFYLASLPSIALAMLLSSVVVEYTGGAAEPQEVVSLLAGSDTPPWTRVILVVAAIGVAPFVEEIFFRGIFLPVLARTSGLRASILAVSLFFALMHLHLPSAAPLFVIALAMAFGYTVSGSLTVAIVMHVMFNAVSVLAVHFLGERILGT